MQGNDVVLEGSWFSRLMASGYGRMMRVGLGVAVMAAAALTLSWPTALIGAFGLVPIAAGVFNLCPVAPVWGGHFIGAKYCGTRPGSSPRGNE